MFLLRIAPFMIAAKLALCVPSSAYGQSDSSSRLNEQPPNATIPGQPIVSNASSQANQHNDLQMQNEAFAIGTVTNGPVILSEESENCGCMDVVLVVDVTGSVNDGQANLLDPDAGLPFVIDEALALSGNDLRVGLVTFTDSVFVRHTWTTDTEAVKDTIATLVTENGNLFPEASDEALHEVLSDISAGCFRAGPDFNEASSFRPDCLKHALLITDALPGGCDDTFTPGIDDVNADLRAQEAAAMSVVISTVYIADFPDTRIVEIMQNYANKTRGLYALRPSNAEGVGQALQQALDRCDDCNSNGIADECDLENESSSDCGGNGVPDECEPDCNLNGIPDDCDVATDAVLDQPPDQISGIPVGPNVGSGAVNFNLTNDTLITEIRIWGYFNNNDEGVGDDFTVIFHSDNGGLPGSALPIQSSVTSTRTLTNATPIGGFLIEWLFELRLDTPLTLAPGSYFVEVFNEPRGTVSFFNWETNTGANSNTVQAFEAPGVSWFTITSDLAIEIVAQLGASVDCDKNGVPDECELDCNSNGVVDACDIEEGISLDCNSNAIPDECENDCNCNNVDDGDDIAVGTSDDCNFNGIPDECDLTIETVVNQQPNQQFGVPTQPGFGSVAENFVIAKDISISEIHFWGYYGNNDEGTADDFTVIFRADDGGMPGAALPVQSSVTSTRSLTTNPPIAGFFAEWRFELQLDTPVELAAGMYFLEIFNEPQGTVDLFHWEAGNLDLLNGVFGSAQAFEVPGVDWFSSATEFAFQIISSPGGSRDLDDDNVPDECTSPCLCLGDINQDGFVNGLDLGGFNTCMLVGQMSGIQCNCADMDANGVIDASDGTLLIHKLLCGIDDCSTPFDDCNTNGVSDACDIAASIAEDANNNDVPDECDICTCPGDVNADGFIDTDDTPCFTACLLDSSNAPGCDCACGDLNGDSVVNGLDIQLFVDRVLQMAGACIALLTQDCNGNTSPDYLDFTLGVDEDCDSNQILDSCDVQSGNAMDCNDNGVPDSCDISSGKSADKNKNDIPDECDTCVCPGDIKTSNSVDADDLAVINVCIDDPDSTSYDCICADMNEDGTINSEDQDLLKIRVICGQKSCDQGFEDCNHNNVEDGCDIDTGISKDNNKNGIPDDCE